MWSLLLSCAAPSPPGVEPWLLPPTDAPVWIDRPVEGVTTAWRFEALLPDDAVATVTCTHAEDPEEVHTVAAGPDRLADLVIHGLLADATYDCALASGDAVETRTIVTEPLPDWIPTWTMTVAGDAGGAYTLLNHGTDIQGDRRSKLLIVDPEGRLRWYYKVPYEAPDLDAQYLGLGYLLYGGGYTTPPTLLDLAGTEWLVATPTNTGLQYNHHVERLPSGQVLTLTVSPNRLDDRRWDGFTVALLDPALTGFDWTWDSQRGVDEGWLPPPADPEEDDPYHANALAEVDGAVLVNLRTLGALVKIDRETGERIWTLGPDGDFVLVDAEGEADLPANWFYGAHAPELDGNRVLLHDNGWRRPGGSFSRVVELEIDEEAHTARVVWEWTEPGWYEPIWGDVDRLPDGNVLVTRDHCDKCTNLDHQRTEILEIDPATNTVVWRMTFQDPHDAGYRAERIDGCAIFANAKYCPSSR